MPLGSKIILVLGLLVFALGVYLVGGQNERSDLAPQLETMEKELQDREAKIKSLEDQLAQAREELKGSGARLEDLKNTIAEREKSLAAAQKQVKDSKREVERLARRAAPLPPARSREPAQTLPAPAPTARRAFESGLYETVRSTAVHEEPLGSSRVLSRISSGTQITVVRSVGEWLEVRSKHGNPPGFVRADDAKIVRRAN
jgi:septal ring factor EnvC (AmiA/AmiB activator)